jgi:hypothetical protein
MGKKIKKKRNDPYVDRNAEQGISEDRAFEIEYDEETNEVILVHHYRVEWGDGFTADVEHCLNINENNDLICELLVWLDIQKKKAMELVGDLVQKSTPELVEGNPIKESKDIMSVEEKKEE